MSEDPIVLNEENTVVKKKKNPFFIVGILLAVVGLLTVAVILLLLYNNNKSPYDNNRVIERVISFTEDDVDTITIETTDENYTLVKNDEDIWEFEAYTTIEVSQPAVAKYLSLFNSVISNDSAGSPTEENLSEFGLEPAKTTVTMHFDDGETTVFRIGDLSPYNNGTFYYCDKVPKIYIVDTEETDAMSVGKLNFYNLLMGDTEVVGDVDPSLSASAYNLDYIEIEADFYDDIIKIRKQTEEEQQDITSLSSYILTEPYEHPVSAAAMKELYTFMKEISGVDIITDDTSKASLKICGLDKPMYDIKYGWNGEEKRIRISQPIDDMCYAYKDDGKYIYAMPVAVADTFNKRPYEYCEDVAFLDKDLNYISEFNVTVKDKTYPFKLSGEDLDMNVTLNGNKIDTESFKQYFINVEGFMVKGEAQVLGDEELMISVEIKFRNGRTKDVLEFYKIDELTAILKENGEAKFAVDMNAVNNIISDVEKLAKGETVNNIW